MIAQIAITNDEFQLLVVIAAVISFCTLVVILQSNWHRFFKCKHDKHYAIMEVSKTMGMDGLHDNRRLVCQCGHVLKTYDEKIIPFDKLLEENRKDKYLELRYAKGFDGEYFYAGQYQLLK